MGSKSRIAKCIVPIIQNHIDSNSIETYIEPFVGGANVMDKIKCKNKYGGDYHKYLIALLKRVQDGGSLLDEVSRELYNDVRSNQDNSKYEDWIVGNVGFLASYNGRWFDGGYAKSGYEKTKNGKRYRDYYQEAKRNILNQADGLEGIQFIHRDYREWKDLKNSVIYCDPPYQNTKQYANSQNFDYEEFWDVVRKWSKGNIVLVSEQNAPNDFISIWQQKVSRSIKATDKSESTEKLFVLNKLKI